MTRASLVWAAAYAASFVRQAHDTYTVSWQMGSSSRHYGRCVAEVAEEERSSFHETAVGVADVAVAALGEEVDGA